MNSDRDGEDSVAPLNLNTFIGASDTQTEQNETIELKVFNEKSDPESEIHHEDDDIVEAKSLLDHSKDVESVIGVSALAMETDPLNQDVQATGDIAANNELKTSRLFDFQGSPLGFLKGNRKKVIVFLAIVGLYLIGFVASLCIERLEYDEIALAQSTLSGKLNDKHIYTSGINFLMPWHELIKFKKNVKELNYSKLQILTTDKLEVRLDIKLYYYLKENELGQLYRKYASEFEGVINKIARSALVNVGHEFSISDFRTKRWKVVKTMKERLEEILNQNHIKLFNIYIHDVRFSSRINNLNLLRILNDIYNEQAIAEKHITLFRQNTTNMVKIIKNQVSFMLESAKTNATISKIKLANIESAYKLDLVEVRSLSQLFNGLDFTQKSNKTTEKKHFMSLCYFDMLAKKDNIRIIQQTPGVSVIKYRTTVSTL